MARRERDILERAVRTVAEQAAKAGALVDEAIDVGPAFSRSKKTSKSTSRSTETASASGGFVVRLSDLS